MNKLLIYIWVAIMLLGLVGCGKQIVTLNIPDDFEYMDEELQDILHSYVNEYI